MDKTVARLRHEGEVERAVITLREITQELKGRGIGAVMLLEEHIQSLENEIERLNKVQNGPLNRRAG